MDPENGHAVSVMPCFLTTKTVVMMKKSFLHAALSCSILFFTALSADAQFTLSGRVTDAVTHQPVSGAAVLLQGRTNTGSYSGDDGRFIISHIRQGNYHLKIAYVGYENFEQSIVIDTDINLQDILLRNTGLFVKPIEIMSTRAGKDAPFTQTTVSADEIGKINMGQDLPFLLKQQPNIITTSDAGAGIGYTNIWIRGSDITRINVTFNGIPVNDAESAGAFFVDIPDIASSTGSIQVQRGVGTSTNGAGAFGATINLSTNEFHAKPYGETLNAYGSFNTWKHEVKAGSGLLNGHFTIDTRLSSITSDGYIDRASSNLKSYYLSAAYLDKKTAIRFNVFSGKEKTYQAWDGVPADSLKTHRTYNDLGLMSDGKYYDNQTDNYIQTYYQLFLNQEINAHWNFNIAAFLTPGKGYYEEYKIGELYSDYHLPDPVIEKDTITSTDLIRDRWLDNYFYGTVFSLNYTGNILNWNLGGGWNRYDGKHHGNVVWAKYGIDKDYQYYYNTAFKNDFNIYWKGDKALAPGLHVFLDLQYRHIRYNIDGFDKDPAIIQHNSYDFFNPKAGISYALNNQDRFYASYAIANKEPNRDDFEAGLKEAPRPEHMGDLEAGYDRSAGSYHLHGNIYYMHYKNQLVNTGKINDVGTSTRTNIPKSYRMGIELNGDVRFARIWTFLANGSFSRNKIRDFTEYIDNRDDGKQIKKEHGETDISFSPSVVGDASVAAAPVEGFSIALSGKYVSRLYLDNTSNRDRSLDPYFVNDLQVHYTWKPKWISAIDFNVMINNIFNVDYLTNGYTYSYISGGKTYTENSYFPQAGTNILAGIDIRF
jgi:iron complex outermembrane receptor protein